MVVVYDVNKFSLQDFPRRTAAILFLAGCNLRCTFCHNPAVVRSQNPKWTEERLFKFLQRRQGKLDGIVITGGEPTIYKDLHLLLQRIRYEYGFAVKLDTNGTEPKMIKNLIDRNLVDYIAMDVKCPYSMFNQITQSKRMWPKVKRSIEIIINSPVDHEFRTTVIPELGVRELKEIYSYVKKGRRFYLQSYAEGTTLHPQKHLQIYDTQQLQDMADAIKKTHRTGCDILVR